MMHGREKSDPAIVAMKPMNKAGRPAAESVERSAGTKGNAEQQSTRRAQDRERFYGAAAKASDSDGRAIQTMEVPNVAIERPSDESWRASSLQMPPPSKPLQPCPTLAGRDRRVDCDTEGM
jgi:hypothetical protein